MPKSREELIKEKLTDDEKTHFDWLKAATINAGDFYRFLQNDENKIKIALAHIKTELDKCKGKQFAAREEANFKDIVNMALRGNDIDEVQQAICMCDLYP
ncbi:Mlp family lipoprotein [Borreliella garinii]|uniref:Mlp family lipoprotein n=1 Tax=Borreliella garinii TaxID=29519 RepID=UPI00399CF341